MTIPIPSAPDMRQIERVRPLVEGRACVVVGSAPLATQTADVRPAECVIAVNGSISSLPGAADLWVLNSKQQDRPKDPALKPLHKAMLKQGKNRTAGHLLLLRGPSVASEGFTLAALDGHGTQYQSWSVLDKVTKRWFEGQVCARVRDSKPCSAGLLTVAIALWCGAAHVRMVGFSFAPGYHYLPNEDPAYWWRDHVEADQRAIRALLAAFEGRISGPILQQVAA
jgi:hypothetical protein